MPKVFISYRRDDSITITGRIHDRLVAVYGDERIFKDVNDMPAGEDFREVLEREVNSSDIVLVIIGPRWLKVKGSDGRLRLHSRNDFVRLEVEMGLNAKSTTLIPVLVHKAQMPVQDELPASIRSLVYRHALSIREDPDFNQDVERLIGEIDRRAGEKKARKGQRRLMIAAVALVIAFFAALFVLISAESRTVTADSPPVTVASVRNTVPTARPDSPSGFGSGVTARIFSDAERMNIRHEPSLLSSVVIAITRFDVVTIYPGGQHGTWLPVRVGEDLNGWFDASILRWEPIYGWRVETYKPEILLYRSPSLSTESVGTLHDGQRVAYGYRLVSSEWGYVVVDETTAGWLYLADGDIIELTMD